MALKAYEEFAVEPLQFPIGGKVYTLPELPISVGLKLSGAIAGKDEEFAQATGTDLWKLVLGPLWDDMLADNVPTAAITRAGLTALADYQYGRERAEMVWETGADPKAIRKYLQGQEPPQESSKPAAASTTKRRASTSGTRTSRRK